MTDSVDREFLNFSAEKLRQMCGRIETCLGKLNEEQIWARGGDNENAVGNLLLHLCGNVRQWIVAGVGGAPDIRERDQEFAAREGLTASELGARLRGVVVEAVAVLEQVSAQRVTERIEVQKYEMSVLAAIYHVVEHFSGHTGQIIFATKMLTSSDLGFHHHLRTTEAHSEKTP